MTLVQIYSIVALLLAFGVSPVGANDVKGILLSRYAPTTQSTVPPVATGGSIDTSFIPTNPVPVVQAPTPACDEQLTLALPLLNNNGGVPSMYQSTWNKSGYAEQYTYRTKVTTKCGSDWVVDYDYDSWVTDEHGGYNVARAASKISNTDLPYSPFINAVSPIAGVHTIVATAHTKNGLATTSPVTVSYISHGILSEAAFVNVIDTKAYIVQ